MRGSGKSPGKLDPFSPRREPDLWQPDFDVEAQQVYDDTTVETLYGKRRPNFSGSATRIVAWLKNGTQYLTAWDTNGTMLGQVKWVPANDAAFVDALRCSWLSWEDLRTRRLPTNWNCHLAP